MRMVCRLGGLSSKCNPTRVGVQFPDYLTPTVPPPPLILQKESLDWLSSGVWGGSKAKTGEQIGEPILYFYFLTLLLQGFQGFIGFR